jgi:nicotinate-nucleotide adenylyltransferase
MAVGPKTTAPLWEVHDNSPEATPRAQRVVENSRGQHKTRRVCASVAEHCYRKPPKTPITCAKVVPASKLSGTNMNISLFGGTFDPIHRGHIALARAAEEKFGLRQIHFVPADAPPHKQKQPLTPYLHRFTMLSLATAENKNWIPSLFEAPEGLNGEAAKKTAAPNYSIDTVRKLKAGLKKADRLFFLIGIDAFLQIQTWHEPLALFSECAFIVASRPGHSLADVASALPDSLRPKSAATEPFKKHPAKGDLVLPGVNVHLLDGLQHAISATAIREAAKAGKPLGKLVDPAVADYIKKQGLYRS